MVRLKRKVTLRQKQSETTQSIPLSKAHSGNSVNSAESPSGNSKWWGVAVVLVLVAGGSFYWLQHRSSNAPTPIVPTLQTAQSASVHVQEDSTGGVESSSSQSTKKASKEIEKGATKSTSTVPLEDGNDVSVEAANHGVNDKTSAHEDTEIMVHAVIRGVYGNGLVRKQKLGSRYATVQHRVNELYRNGEVQ